MNSRSLVAWPAGIAIEIEEALPPTGVAVAVATNVTAISSYPR
jgi:hypothetical protein